MQAMLIAPICVAMTLAVVDGKSILQRFTMDNQTLVRFGSFIVIMTLFFGAVVVAVTDLIRDPSAALPVGIVSILTSAFTFAIHTVGVNLGSNISGSGGSGQNGTTTLPTPPTAATTAAGWLPLSGNSTTMLHTGVGDGPVKN